MIRQTEEKGRDELLKICGRSAIGCKIAGLVVAYGFDKGFTTFWMEEGGRAAYAMFDGLMLLAGTPSDPQEAADFLLMSGAGKVLCTVRASEELGLDIVKTGDILKKVLPGSPAIAKEEPPSVREIFSLLHSCGMADDFEPFYMDLSHRLRHGTAMAFSEEQGGELIGAALVSAITGSSAILSAIAVREDRRREGIGSALVKKAEESLGGKTVYLFREKNACADFYRKLGYDWCDAWVEGELAEHKTQENWR